MCNCRSYNGEIGSEPEVLLDYGAFFKDGERSEVSVDKCIADVMVLIWGSGVETGGCCCGHNGHFGPPSVFIKNASDAERVAKILSMDNREWHVMFWA